MRMLCLTGQWSPGNDPVFQHAAIYAVTLFFFITGFIFWTRLQKDPRPQIGRHLISRIRRLVPAYWAGLGVILIYSFARTDWNGWDYGLPIVKNTLSWLLFTLPGLENGFYGPNIGRIYLSTIWTLKLEWVFYLIIPFCGWFVRRLWRTVLFIGIFVVLHLWSKPGSAEIAITEEGFRQIAAVPAAFAFLFSGGIVAAALCPLIRSRFDRVDFKGPVFSLVGIGTVLVLFFAASPRYGFAESTWLIGPFLLIALGNDWFGLLVSKPMLFLGKISYSIYLIHGLWLYLSFYFVVSFYSIESMPLAFFYLLIAGLGGILIAIAALWYRCFEAPFMKAAPNSVQATNPENARP